MPISTATSTWRRLVRFVALEDGREHYGEPVEADLDVGLAFGNGLPINVHVLDTHTPWDDFARRSGEILTVYQLLSPISPEMCGAIRATGLSYKDHAAEMNLPYPSVPVLFHKPSTCLADPNSVIPIPKGCQNEEMDYEVELAVIISRRCKNVSEEDALNHVLGYTVANDLTARKHQTTSSQWGYAKGFDYFCPMGPVIVSARVMPDPHAFALQTTLNGELMQNGSARKMIFSLARVISYLSQGSTLLPGTIIITGTPPGIGDGRNPKIWLKHGDDVRCWISHGIGTLINTIEYE
ncbi:hypothetical protein P7C73_g1325, partial [Tremellales sp. Uapishka_1]